MYHLGELSSQTRCIWLVLHGYGQLPRYWIKRFESLVDAQTVVVAPEGLSKFYLEGTSGRVGASWMTKDERLAEISDHLHYLTQLTAQLLAAQPQCKIVLLGFSQGGAAAARLAAAQPELFAALVLWSAVFPPDWQPAESQTQLPSWLVYGNNDPYLPATRLNGLLNEARAQLPALQTLAFDGGHDVLPGPLAELSRAILAIL